MKKLLVALILLFALFTALVYILIPAKLTITSSGTATTTDNGALRFVIDEHAWNKWWKYDSTSRVARNDDSVFLNNGTRYILTQKLYKGAGIHIKHNNTDLESQLSIIPIPQDSVGIRWACAVNTGSDPFSRFAKYLEARRIKKSMDDVLKHLTAFLSKKENVYGINIERTSIADTAFISAKSIMGTYPTTPQIYALIKTIQDFAAKNKVKQTGFPIYNVAPADNNQFQLMAAIPVERSIEGNHQFSPKKMVRGGFMVTEVIGGEYTVNQAAKKLKEYFDDYRKTSMAINFTMLVTDRMLQPDTSKWVTKLYQPVY